jgi:glutamyl-tRNA synthetase
LQPYVSDDFPYDEEAVGKRLKKARPEHMIALRKALSQAQPFEHDTLEAALRSTAEQLDLKAGDLIHPTRIALTGQSVGPSVFSVVEAVGREKTVERLKRMEEFLEKQGVGSKK